MIQDTDKRLEFLFDRLSAQQVPDDVLAPLVVISQAIQAGDYGTSQKTVMELVTSNHPEETKWVVGLKRLVEFLTRT